MAFPIAPIISGAMQLAGDAYNVRQQQKMNTEQRWYNDQQYLKQKNDALEMWHMQNDYNSPQQQMKRYQEAGLNPNFIYGRSGDNSASNVNMPSSMAFNPKAPQIQPQDAISSYMNTKLQTAQLDNMKAQNTVLLEDAALKRVQSMGVYTKTLKDEFNLDLDKRLSPEFRQQMINNLMARTRQANSQGSLNDLNHAFQLDTYDARSQQINLINKGKGLSNTFMEKHNRLKQMDIDLRKKGLNPSDPAYMRIMSSMLDQIYDTNSNEFKNPFK